MSYNYQTLSQLLTDQTTGSYQSYGSYGSYGGLEDNSRDADYGYEETIDSYNTISNFMDDFSLHTKTGSHQYKLSFDFEIDTSSDDIDINMNGNKIKLKDVEGGEYHLDDSSDGLVLDYHLSDSSSGIVSDDTVLGDSNFIDNNEDVDKIMNDLTEGTDLSNKIEDIDYGAMENTDIHGTRNDMLSYDMYDINDNMDYTEDLDEINSLLNSYYNENI